MHALFLSPHLDDVAFSVGGTLLRLVQRGWQVSLCTVFTGSVQHPVGFALRCQTDKGLPPEVDYMALRREEEHQFARLAAVTRLHCLPYPEAPHRGYESAAALFNGVLPHDNIWRPVASDLRRLISSVRFDVVFAPQGLGNHVDHLHLIRAVLQANLAEKTCWYRDTPYAMRQPQARPDPRLPAELREVGVDISATLEDKLAGCCAYESQIGFQFGGTERLRTALPTFHQQEAARLGLAGYAEGLLVPSHLVNLICEA
ncbi:MAG: PIG-L family deacetylase [Chloroflexaceae bacterium]|jgi:LmbE family N-acetylglucosaminyl deacetylase|nr:PIG-L family deacetylase [Chloroflexaceae bacterium]